jgi:hypothetical protein
MLKYVLLAEAVVICAGMTCGLGFLVFKPSPSGGTNDSGPQTLSFAEEEYLNESCGDAGAQFYGAHAALLSDLVAYDDDRSLVLGEELYPVWIDLVNDDMRGLRRATATLRTLEAPTRFAPIQTELLASAEVADRAMDALAGGADDYTSEEEFRLSRRLLEEAEREFAEAMELCIALDPEA